MLKKSNFQKCTSKKHIDEYNKEALKNNNFNKNLKAITDTSFVIQNSSSYIIHGTHGTNTDAKSLVYSFAQIINTFYPSINPSINYFDYICRVGSGIALTSNPDTGLSLPVSKSTCRSPYLSPNLAVRAKRFSLIS